MYDLQLQHFTVKEAVDSLSNNIDVYKDRDIVLSKAAQEYLHMWLQELLVCRESIQKARMALEEAEIARGK